MTALLGSIPLTGFARQIRASLLDWSRSVVRFRIRRRLLPLSTLACLASSTPVMGQGIFMASASSPVVIHSMHSVTIPPIVGVVGSTLVPAGGGSAPCPGACYESIVDVRANTKWQLQVALSQSADHVSVEWFETGTSVVHHLRPGEYFTVASGAQPTLQRAVSLSLGVREEIGTAVALGASQVAGLLSYRVVPLP